MILFTLGRVLATPGAMDALEYAEVLPGDLLHRHVMGDWGDLDAADKAHNDAAVKTGQRILSAYTLATGARIWIITEHDRSVTTLLLPNEY